ncbi:Methionine--tRNA ligase [Symmachiella macrocystis]|uniref:methionine--tRNA ligase n=2 Tax=Symmachiella TaxID=2795780 RepID=A0A5C6BL64_9PLAN|nr:class I tRNA ligase family protein [Symmachiella macrocystis]TWU12397.1 Methionine--tRNA ligase [Symmachiella macrocystis]
MPDRSRFYVTTPIYYVNDRPHLGHVYTTMVADVVARYHRLIGDETFFLTGVDEHAAKVSEKAAEMGMTPQAWADQNAAAFREVFERLEITNNDFVRTSSEHHKAAVSRYVQALLDSGDVYQGDYVGWYDAGQEEYVPDNKALQNDYKSEVNGKPLIRKSEKNYFFKLESYREPLLAFYAQRDADGVPFVQPDARRNEIVNRIKEMDDVPISRSGSGGWGIPVPGEAEQTIYVWIDALFNYLTFVDTDADSPMGDRRKFWQAGAVHFIAKDILWFHAAIWPALLLALQKCPGFEWVNLPRQVYSHSYWVSDSGQKMSKSLGNFLDPAAIDNYVETFGLDALRYFLSTRGPLGVSDSAFSPELFIEVYNSDLANTFGNSCSRVANMIGKYFDGQLPAPLPADDPAYLPLKQSDWAGEYMRHFEVLDLTRAGDAALQPVRDVDSFIEQTQPFRMAKDETQRPAVGTVLYQCTEALRIASVLLWPFLPDACEIFWQRIGCGAYADMLADNGSGHWEQLTTWGQLQPGTPIEKGAALFPRYDAERAG